MIRSLVPWKRRIRLAREQGDKEAFDLAYGAFYRANAPRVKNKFRYDYPNLALEILEDLMHDSFLLGYEDAWSGKVKKLDALGSYVMRVMKNTTNIYLRKQKKEPEILSLDEWKDSGLGEWPVAEKLEEAYKVLAQLSEKCQEILRMYFARYPMQEIATDLSYSSAAVVRKTKERCFKKLVELGQAHK